MLINAHWRSSTKKEYKMWKLINWLCRLTCHFKEMLVLGARWHISRYYLFSDCRLYFYKKLYITSLSASGFRVAKFQVPVSRVPWFGVHNFLVSGTWISSTRVSVIRVLDTFLGDRDSGIRITGTRFPCFGWPDFYLPGYPGFIFSGIGSPNYFILNTTIKNFVSN